MTHIPQRENFRYTYMNECLHPPADLSGPGALLSRFLRSLICQISRAKPQRPRTAVPSALARHREPRRVHSDQALRKKTVWHDACTFHFMLVGTAYKSTVSVVASMAYLFLLQIEQIWLSKRITKTVQESPGGDSAVGKAVTMITQADGPLSTEPPALQDKAEQEEGRATSEPVQPQIDTICTEYESISGRLNIRFILKAAQGLSHRCLLPPKHNLLLTTPLLSRLLYRYSWSSYIYSIHIIKRRVSEIKTLQTQISTFLET